MAVSIGDIFKGDLAVNGNWVVGAIAGDIAWPTETHNLRFRGRELFLVPATDQSQPFIAVNLGAKEAFEVGQVVLSHFLSSLTWVEGRGATVSVWSGGNLPRPIGTSQRVTASRQGFYVPYLPDPTDRHARLALALYREGLTLNHPAYQVLSFFKVLNIFLKGGPAQKSWINANVADVADFMAKRRLSELQATQSDIGKYLYESGRCAVAHANEDPTVDPEDANDTKRMWADLPLVEALAELAIERQFGIKSTLTVYREHLYELAGFKELLGESFLEMLSNGMVAKQHLPMLPRMSIRLVGHESFAPMEVMACTMTAAADGVATLHCTSRDQRVLLPLYLDFRSERLRLDPFRQLGCADDGSAAAAHAAASVVGFQKEYLGNGILEIWNADSGSLLGRRDAHIPENIDFGRSFANLDQLVEKLDTEAKMRAQKQLAEDATSRASEPFK